MTPSMLDEVSILEQAEFEYHFKKQRFALLMLPKTRCIFPVKVAYNCEQHEFLCNRPSYLLCQNAMITTTYRQLLKAELDQRIENNPSYSLRAMAAQMKISSGMLSSILNGKRNLSAKRAIELAKTLKFDKRKTDYFVALVQFDSVKSEEVRAEILETIYHLAPKSKAFELDLDVFSMIADWHHVPILKMTRTTLPSLTPEIISKHLDISLAQASEALDRLFRLGLLETDEQGHIRSCKSQIITNAPTSSALRHFHRQMLTKAIESLETQTATEKFVGSETFAFNEEDLEKAKEIMEECFSRIVRLASARQDKKNVYHLGIQMFRLTKDIK